MYLSCCRGKAKEGLLKDHMAADGGEGDEADGKAGLGRPSSHGKGPAEGRIMLLHYK